MEAEEMHALQSAFCKTVCDLGIKNLDCCQQSPETFASYAELLVKCACHPSISFSMSCFGVFTGTYYRNLPEFRDEVMRPFVPELFESFSSKCARGAGDPEQPDAPDYVLLDFDSSDEYWESFSALRSHAALIIRHLTSIDPVSCVNNANQMLMNVTNVLGPFEGDAVTEEGCASMESRAFCVWDQASFVFENVMQGLEEHSASIQAESGQLIQELEAMAQVILELDLKDPVLLPKLLDCVGALGWLVLSQSDDTLMLSLIDKCFATMTFSLPGNSNRVSADTKAARRKGFTSFIKLTKRLSDRLLPYLENIVEQATSMWSSGAIHWAEVSFIFDSLATLSNAMEDPFKQQGFLMEMLGFALEEWNGPTIQAVVGDPLYLLVLMEAIPMPDGCPFENPAETRTLFHSLINIFVSVSRRVKNIENNGGIFNAFCEVESVIAPGIMAVIQSLHCLWKPDFLAGALGQETAQFLLSVLRTPTLHEVEALLGRRPGDKSEDSDPQMVAMQKWVEAVRESSYQCVEFMARHVNVLYSLPDVQTILMDNIFCHLEWFENRHLRRLCKHVVDPLFKNCPPEIVLDTMQQPLATFFTMACNRLTSDWEIYLEEEIRRESAEGTAEGARHVKNMEESEIVADKMLRFATKGIIEWIDQNTAFLHQSEIFQMGWNEEVGPHMQLLFGVQEVCQPVLILLIRALCWPDATCCMRAASVGERYLRVLGSDPNYVDAFGCEMLTNALRTIMSHEKSVHAPLIRLITNIYVNTCEVSEHPRALLGSLPDKSPSSILELEKRLSNCNPSAYRGVFRWYLQDIAGMNVSSSLFKKPRSILNLPARLELNKRMDLSTPETPSSDLEGLSALFR